MAENQHKKTVKGHKRTSRKRAKFPAKQGKSEVGYANPPKEHQFKPGQSGNPKGPPKPRTQLWTYFCWYMGMTDAELAKLDRKVLTQAQQTALKLVKDMKKGKYSGSIRLARYTIDRDEGKVVEHLVINEDQNVLTDEDCDRIRQILRANFEAAENRSATAQ